VNDGCSIYDSKEKSKLNYELIGLTVHLGSLDGGHYVAYTKREDKWFLFNDEDFEEVKESEVLKQ
jgi:ubiquitin C-terminal hydrolase